MGITAKMPTQLDHGQAIRSAFNDSDKTIAVGSFVGLKIGHKVTQTAVNATTDDYTFLDNGTTLYVIRIIYTTSTKDVLSSVERIA